MDADYFLAVSRSLLAGTNSHSAASQLAQDARVAATLADIQAQQLKQVDDFMGFCRVVDFSQFKVRGHYTHTERLGRYFQCVTWLGRIDVPVAGGPWKRCPDDETFASPRETAWRSPSGICSTARGNSMPGATWRKTVETFVGVTEFTDFRTTQRPAGRRGHPHALDIPDLATLQRLQR